MAVSKTCLSAGEIIRTILAEDEEVSSRVNTIYPIVAEKSILPYIVYRRAALEQNPTKNNARKADTATIEVICYTEHYTEGVELAEAVRDALDGVNAKNDDLVMRSCYLVDSEEAWENDAFVQQLMFNVKI